MIQPDRQPANHEPNGPSGLSSSATESIQQRVESLLWYYHILEERMLSDQSSAPP